MGLTSRQRQAAAGAVILVVLLCAVILLRAEGRLWICSCGRLLLWSGQVCSANNSQQFLDPFSFTHILHGFLYFWLFSLLLKRINPAWQLTLVVALAATWEVFENSALIIGRYRADTASLGYSGDTIVNSLGDILCCAVGFAIARLLGFRRSLVVFAAVEVVLLFWIRDSLLLEILMLVHPVSAIKAWQICR
jgi:Protein of unknown function (DUF2585)